MLTRRDALAILAACDIAAGADYHTLSSATVDALLAEADKRKYRKPKDANGSRARYFHAYVQRRDVDRPFAGFVSRVDVGLGRWEDAR